MRFSVWAPRAERVELVASSSQIALEPRERGWFEVDADIAPGTDYSFSLDGGDALPDPRSPWQPEGVDGPSRTVDHGSYPWSTETWRPPPLEEWVVYELHIGTFSNEGTFDGALTKLSHLVDLGVTAVEIMPVNSFSGNHGWGYDGVDLYAPHHPYGGPEGLKRLVDACHASGLSVILDVVYNHLGPAGNYLARYGHYFTDSYSTPWGDAVNFDDAHSDAVRRFFLDNALMWLEDYRIDALRLDAIHAILDTSAKHFLEELSELVDDLEARSGRPKYLIAESDLNDPRVVTPRDVNGYGMDAQWSDDFHHALHSVLTGERNGYYRDFGSLEQLATVLQTPFVYAGTYSEHRRRRHGRPPVGIPSHRFLAYIQNHDQIGNRAAGERIAHLAGTDRAKIAAALVLTSGYIPMLFQGEEWAASTPFQYFTDHADPDLGRAVSEGRRSEFASFGWAPEDVPDPQSPDTFARSKLKWSEIAESPHGEMYEWYRNLIALRKSDASLGASGAVAVHYDEAGRWLVVERGEVTIACNLADEERPLPIPASRRVKELLASKAWLDGGDTVTLAPVSIVLWSAR